MASSKEMHQSTRPLTHQRPSLSSSSLSAAAAGRQSHARTNSHSHSGSSTLFGGSLNPAHRVTRRKSVTTPCANVAAITAAMRDSSDPTTAAAAVAAAAAAAAAAAGPSSALPIAHGARRLSRQFTTRYALTGSLPATAASSSLSSSSAAAAAAAAALLSPDMLMSESKPEHARDDVIDDESNDLSADEGATGSQKARARRASDGQPLIKEGKKSNRVEIRCETCGKGYKHSSCLTKHLWEHTPEWSLTSKLLISKHQQVQLLEAASVLVAMNGNPKDRSSTPPDSAKDFTSEPVSASPSASGYSEQADRQSSANTTPPPIHETSYFGRRQSSSRAFSPSFQSPLSRQFSASSVPRDGQFSHFRQINYGPRLNPSDRAPAPGQDDHELAAAVELLSCSFNSSNNGSRNPSAAVMASTVPNPPLVSIVPPMPSVPASYLDQAASLTSAGFINSYPSKQPESFTRGEMRRGSEDVRMEDSEDDFDTRGSRSRSDEDDDGVFGRMEE